MSCYQMLFLTCQTLAFRLHLIAVITIFEQTFKVDYKKAAQMFIIDKISMGLN